MKKACLSLIFSVILTLLIVSCESGVCSVEGECSENTIETANSAFTKTACENVPLELSSDTLSGECNLYWTGLPF